MGYPTGLWTTVRDMIDEDGQRVLFKRRESPDEPKYMLDYPFDCFTACAIFEPMTDDMRNWRGVGTCYLSVGCSDMFIHLIDALNDRPFGIGGIEGETGRYDSKDFETNLYSAMSTACSQWIDKIKEYDSRYNKKVDKMSFNDMVKSIRLKKDHSRISKDVDIKGEIINAFKSSYDMTSFAGLSWFHGDNTYWDGFQDGVLCYHSMEYRNFMMNQLNTTISVSDNNIHCHISVYLDNEDKGSKDWDMSYNPQEGALAIASDVINEVTHYLEVIYYQE